MDLEVRGLLLTVRCGEDQIGGSLLSMLRDDAVRVG